MALQPEKAEIVTLAACTLHNYIRCHKAAIEIMPDSDNSNDGNWRAYANGGLANIDRLNVGQNATNNAKDIRNRFCEYFNGPGIVEWQDRMV